MAIFKGAGVALITPFTQDGKVDYESMGNIIETQIEGGTDAIVVVGTTGEASTLSHAEHLEAIKFTVNQVNKRIPVIAGTGSNCTDTAIYLSEEAARYGVDGVLVVTPYYNKATQKGLIEHYTAIASAIDVPIIMYNVPGRTGCGLAPETVGKLVKEVDNIVGIKEATGNLNQVTKIMQVTNGEIDLYSGCDELVVPIMSVGGIGVISVLSNIAPKQTHDMVYKYLEGDTKGSLELQLRFLPLINALFSEVNPIPIKKAAELMGLCGGTLRRPLTEMEAEHVEVLKREMLRCGLEFAECGLKLA